VIASIDTKTQAASTALLRPVSDRFPNLFSRNDRVEWRKEKSMQADFAWQRPHVNEFYSLGGAIANGIRTGKARC
jgi:hypothetical protein